jgi:hypothetical protein
MSLEQTLSAPIAAAYGSPLSLMFLPSAKKKKTVAEIVFATVRKCHPLIVRHPAEREGMFCWHYFLSGPG